MGLLNGKFLLQWSDEELWLGAPARRILHRIPVRQGIQLLPSGLRGGGGIRPVTFAWGTFFINDIRVTQTSSVDNTVESIVDGALTHPLMFGGLAEVDGAELFLDLTERAGARVAHMQASLTGEYSAAQARALKLFLRHVFQYWGPSPQFSRLFQDRAIFDRVTTGIDEWDGGQATLPKIWPEAECR